MTASAAVVSRYLSSSSKSGFCQSPVESPTQEQSCPIGQVKISFLLLQLGLGSDSQGPGPSILQADGKIVQREDIGERLFQGA